MNEEQAKQYVNEKCKGLPVTSEEDARKVLDIIWQAACEWKDSQVLRTTEEDPCPACRPNTVCRTPSCGRLKGKRQEPIAPPPAQINQQLAEALERLISVAERCDGWESFPRHALEDAEAALAATQMRGDA